MDLRDLVHFMVTTTSRRIRTIQKMQSIATRPGLFSKSAVSGERPEGETNQEVPLLLDKLDLHHFCFSKKKKGVEKEIIASRELLKRNMWRSTCWQF